jgi:hypothetical protein
MPGILNFPEVRLDNTLGLSYLLRRQPYVHSQVNRLCKPELSLAVRMGNMHMNPRFLAREEKQSEWSFPQDCRGHSDTVPDRPMRWPNVQGNRPAAADTHPENEHRIGGSG